MFVSGFLALCSAVGTGTATELTGAGYTRQPVRFGTPRNGVSAIATPWTFPGGLAGPIAGRALFDAPTGGNLLLVLPFSAARAGWPVQNPDRGDVGEIMLRLSALGSYPEGEAYTGTLAAGAVVGTCWDEMQVVTRHQPNPTTGQYDVVLATAPLSAGVALKITSGVLGVA